MKLFIIMSMTCNQLLYHGATVEVREPLTHVGRQDLDFGQGFYVTNDIQQAVDWSLTKAARRKNAKAISMYMSFVLTDFLLMIVTGSWSFIVTLSSGLIS